MICILGSGGQVGRALARKLKDQKAQFTALGHAEADFLKPELVIDQLERIKPQIIINAAAFTQVDLAEKEQEAAIQINSNTPGAIAKWCKENQCILVHYSTDYVFSGTGDEPWSENSPTDPVNFYGESKLRGENAIRNSGCTHFIFRTSWVYDELGNNFFNKMILLGRERAELNVVSDQIGSPTYASDLAQATLELLNRNVDLKPLSGTYHLCGTGFTSWFHFAEEIFKLIDVHQPLKLEKLNPTLTKNYKTPANRPLNSRLNQEKALSRLNLKLPDWQTSLKECIKCKYGSP